MAGMLARQGCRDISRIYQLGDLDRTMLAVLEAAEHSVSDLATALALVLVQVWWEMLVASVMTAAAD